MNEGDRSSMHEAMEQQKISISKAGINASLRTRCAVLAAANPKSGRFEPVSEVPFTAQINLAPPLISRFDVIWLLTDDPEMEKDAKIAQHIIDNRLLGVSELLVNEGTAPDPTKSSAESGLKKTETHGEVLSRDLIRKYIAYAKRSVHPSMEPGARKKIVDYYVSTRKQVGDFSDTVAITARSLEALARLAEASARLRLSQVATVEDADRAIRLTNHWREDLMGGNFDETTLQTGQKGTARNREKTMLNIVSTLANDNNGVAQHNDVLNEAERYKIDRSTAEDILEKFHQEGRLFRPSGYDTHGLP